MAFVLKTPIQKRFSDIDSFCHVNNVSQQMYFDLGKQEFYQKMLPERVLTGKRRIITAATSTSYLGQIRMQDDIYVTTTVSKIGTKSITLFQRLICRKPDGSEEVRMESTSVMVAFDFELQESFPVPNEWRQHLLQE